jgi:hypothetical protein
MAWLSTQTVAGGCSDRGMHHGLLAAEPALMLCAPEPPRCRYEGSWRAGKRHGQGLMVFPDGCMFRGAWEDDEWLQSAAEPALCRLRGGGLSTALAGCKASFTIEVCRGGEGASWLRVGSV